MISIDVSSGHFSLYNISNSGQCFRMNVTKHTKESCEAYLVAFGKVLFMSQVGTKVYMYCSDEDYQNIWKSYFDMDTVYSKFAVLIDNDDFTLKESYEYGKGIRILRQDLWETLISFIISQQNNIGRIKKIIETLSARYGEAFKVLKYVITHIMHFLLLKL